MKVAPIYFLLGQSLIAGDNHIYVKSELIETTDTGGINLAFWVIGGLVTIATHGIYSLSPRRKLKLMTGEKTTHIIMIFDGI